MNVDRRQRVKKLFQQVLDRPAAERDAFLRKTCGNDQETLAEVRSLLKYHDSRTITPTHMIDVAAAVGDESPKSFILGIPSPWNWRPTDPNRLRASFIALALAALLVALGFWLKYQVEGSLRTNLENQLKATLDSNVAAVQFWLRLQQHEVAQLADHDQFREHFAALLAAAEPPDAPLEQLRQLPPYAEVVDILTPLLDRGVRAVNVTNAQGTTIATSRADLQQPFSFTPLGTRLIAPVFLGQQIVLPPIRGSTIVENKIPGISDVPIILIGCPIRDSRQRVAGGLFAAIASGNEFTELLNLASPSMGFDNYAFGPEGQLLSASQYEPQLYSLGMIDSAEPGASVLKIQLRDPGVDLTAGQENKVPLEQRPLTKMAAAAVTGADGSDLDGYRDYRGVRVVGAWRWLKPYGFGVATEIDYDDAYAALSSIRRALWSLFGLTVLFAGVAFVSSLSMFRLRREIDAVRQLGQYTLENLIGEGGMGKVYKARHALMRRPTAVKVLNGERAGPSAIARFEREVQLASSLTHPNTVEIFDYGRTDDGIFYFAMEYLPGITLEDLVRRDGAISTPRVLCILRQVLASLAEAHGLGLVHRDIKPANIILCRRGGVADFVKVVDFGLAKDLSFNLAPEITQSGLISGTPLYIAPECLDEPASASPRSDIYAVGAVMFYLLTGREMFTGGNLFEVLRKVSHEQPPRVSDVVRLGIPAELVELVHRCVARNPADRPASVEVIMEVVDSLAAKYPWAQADADRWWQAYELNTAGHGTPVMA